MISKVNAGLAGVEHLIEFGVCDFEQRQLFQKPLALSILIPEYGERLGEISELEITYARIGDFMKKKCQGYLGYIFTGNLDLAKKIGLKASRRIEFYTGKIDCRLLEYELYGGSKRSPKQSSDGIGMIMPEVVIPLNISRVPCIKNLNVFSLVKGFSDYIRKQNPNHRGYEFNAKICNKLCFFISLPLLFLYQAIPKPIKN
jgi:hypothetical protein